MSTVGEMHSEESIAKDGEGDSNLRQRKFVERAQETIEQGNRRQLLIKYHLESNPLQFSASELLKRKIPCAGYFLSPKRLWLKRISTPNCDVVMVFSSGTQDSILLWLLSRLRQSPGLTVHVRHHASTQSSAFYLTAPFTV